MTAQPADDGWTPICEVDKLPSDRGVTALVQGHAIAVFLTPDGSVYAIGNHDPFSRVTTLGRGIVGIRGDVPFVASTAARQAFRPHRPLSRRRVGQRAGLRRADRGRGGASDHGSPLLDGRRGLTGTTSAVAIAATPSPRPVSPRPSVVVADTVTGAPPAADSASSASARRGPIFGRLPTTCTATLPIS